MLRDPGFFRRLKFYIFGFLIGALIVNVVFKGKACRMPGTIKLEELREQKLIYTQKAVCQMQCMAIDSNRVKQLLNEGSINYKNSNAQNTPCATYAVVSELKNKDHLQLMIADCDSISKILTVIVVGKDTCSCN